MTEPRRVICAPFILNVTIQCNNFGPKHLILKSTKFRKFNSVKVSSVNFVGFGQEYVSKIILKEGEFDNYSVTTLFNSVCSTALATPGLSNTHNI